MKLPYPSATLCVDLPLPIIKVLEASALLDGQSLQDWLRQLLVEAARSEAEALASNISAEFQIPISEPGLKPREPDVMEDFSAPARLSP